MILAFKIIVHLLTITGVALGLGVNLKWFVDKERIDFFNIISKEFKISPNHPGAQKFLKTYFYSLEISESEKKQIEKVIFTGIYEDSKSGKEIYSGMIKVKSTEGQTSRALATYSELREWAFDTPFGKWFAWWIIAIGVFLETLILRKRRTRSIKLV